MCTVAAPTGWANGPTVRGAHASCGPKGTGPSPTASLLRTRGRAGRVGAPIPLPAPQRPPFCRPRPRLLAAPTAPRTVAAAPHSRPVRSTPLIPLGHCRHGPLVVTFLRTTKRSEPFYGRCVVSHLSRSIAVRPARNRSAPLACRPDVVHDPEIP